MNSIRCWGQVKRMKTEKVSLNLEMSSSPATSSSSQSFLESSGRKLECRGWGGGNGMMSGSIFHSESLAGKGKREQDRSWRAQQDPAKVFPRGRQGDLHVWNTSDFKARFCFQMCNSRW